MQTKIQKVYISLISILQRYKRKYSIREARFLIFYKNCLTKQKELNSRRNNVKINTAIKVLID